MVQLRVLAGRHAGREAIATRFPWQVGRAPSADWTLVDDGVWDRHFEVALGETDRLVARVHAGALAMLNGQPFRNSPLRSGDVLEAGSLKIQFWLSPTRPRGLRWRESMTWIGFGLLVASQLALILWLSGSGIFQKL